MSHAKQIDMQTSANHNAIIIVKHAIAFVYGISNAEAYISIMLSNQNIKKQQQKNQIPVRTKSFILATLINSHKSSV